jgi:hypothetical protein
MPFTRWGIVFAKKAPPEEVRNVVIPACRRSHQTLHHCGIPIIGRLRALLEARAELLAKRHDFRNTTLRHIARTHKCWHTEVGV